MTKEIKTVAADKRVVFEDKVGTLLYNGYEIVSCGVTPDWDQTSMSSVWWAILEKDDKNINDDNWS